jgi:hypothetical protein
VKHTPGPWLISPYTTGLDEIIIEEKAGNNRICVVTGDAGEAEGQEESKANARLIAAAPELLEMLKRVRQGYRNLREFKLVSASTEDSLEVYIAEMDRLIAKAEVVRPETAPASAEPTLVEAKP